MSGSEFPMFSVDDHDRDGDLIEKGIYLHHGNARVKVAETIEEFDAFIEHLQSMREEIAENY